MSRQRMFKGLWSTPGVAMSLGCLGCVDLGKCGGQTVLGAGFNCLDHCCKQPDSCQVVCPKARIFADRIREIKGFDLETPYAAPIEPPNCSSYIPMLFHGSARKTLLRVPSIAIPLYRFFDKEAGCRFATREDVARIFKVEQTTSVFLSGVAQDFEVERWWKLGSKGRNKVIANLQQLGIAMVTTPNFSLIVDRPRWDDLHSMRRIAEVYHELVSEGQAAALHVNGRTEHDFSRWANYIVAHSEVTHIAYEFTTGTKNPARMLQHVSWLIDLALASGRRLGLILRGGVQVAAQLSTHFDITLIDSSSFEKAQHREIAMIDENGRRRWIKKHTPTNMPVDALLEENVRVSQLWFTNLLPKLSLAA